MPEKQTDTYVAISEFFKNVWPFVWTFLLSSWGGVVSHIQRMRMTHSKFNIRELAFDLIISSFAGLLTYMFCSYSKINGEMSAILIAISGHMGTRAIAGFERMRDRIFGIAPVGEDIAINRESQNDKQP